MIDQMMIQSALLGMQQAKQANFDTTIGEEKRMGWWWKAYVANRYCMEIMIYLDKKSPTGFMISIDYIDEEPITIYNQPLESFEEFQMIFNDKKFLPTIFKNWKKKK